VAILGARRGRARTGTILPWRIAAGIAGVRRSTSRMYDRPIVWATSGQHRRRTV